MPFQARPAMEAKELPTYLFLLFINLFFDIFQTFIHLHVKPSQHHWDNENQKDNAAGENQFHHTNMKH
jgi:hypothetical protein